MDCGQSAARVFTDVKYCRDGDSETRPSTCLEAGADVMNVFRLPPFSRWCFPWTNHSQHGIIILMLNVSRVVVACDYFE